MRAIFLIGLNFVRTQWIVVTVMSVYILASVKLYVPGGHKNDFFFLLRLHFGYTISVIVMMAIPVLQTERKSRRILAVLSKGIYRWQYLSGLLCGCAMSAAIFCLLLGVVVLWLGQTSGVPANGLPAVMMSLFCCCLAAASTGLFFAVFLHPLLAILAASLTLTLPLILNAIGWPGSELFPLGGLFKAIALDSGFQTAGSLPLIGMAILQTLIFWIAAVIVFNHRDVTISPE
jgi:ABC-type transport system involved in multi-copper enzyme maturation permease subunit